MYTPIFVGVDAMMILTTKQVILCFVMLMVDPFPQMEAEDVNSKFLNYSVIMRIINQLFSF